MSLNAIAVNQVVHRVGWNFPALIEQLGVVGEGEVRNVLAELPHVRRTEELPRRQLVDDEVTVRQRVIHAGPPGSV